MWCSPALCFPCAARGLGGVRALGQMCSVHLPGMPVPRMGNEGSKAGRGQRVGTREEMLQQGAVRGSWSP